ncbi:MAG: undecaprenyl/decaprenyl-phosphate alpha-N-acetylglucosaminyl 1-phosphate transferase [Candidatus Electrothrix sp. AW3_4]|nr:undecaprenyl/decaprenyl-phosphate alpha-N-acetylglucosaminyl 1-phosphate transferase [Candidatus Electrothrix gigas]
MVTVLFIFIVASLASLTLTPVVRQLALHFDLTDKPSARKMHSGKIPRIGGVALFGSFFLPFLLLFLFNQYSPVTEDFFSDNSPFCFVTGALLIFLLGLLDDIRELSFLLKIFGQLLIALFIYCCGFQITAVTTPFGADFAIGFFSLPLTIFWFLLVINAINFIDGLDGLAAGICLFVSLAMLFVCLVNGQLTSALAFAALAGALLGFLRYNFYPASIFMGDSGSYFLGYCLAILSIGGTIKGQVATALLIPVIALGIPLMDTLWAPLRRFMNGQSIFQADNKHIHHRLVRLGLTHRRAVLALYCLTVLLGIASMFLVHTQNQSAALIIFVLGIGFIGLLHYLSDSSLFSVENIASWARDLTDESGISLQRRLFFQHQRKISAAADPEQLWEAVCASLEILAFDYAEFQYIEQNEAGPAKSSQRTLSTFTFSWRGVQQGEGGTGTARPALSHASVLRIELPLHQLTDNGTAMHFGSLLLVKDMSHTVTEPYLLKRVEQLRRSMIAALEKFDGIRSAPLLSRSSLQFLP